ncbi:MAG: glyceraldehyde 3-phosphate dehydrogenase NAD-binding domain-containing protein [Coriobacteriia bacterium]|jgi:glyceraldehyde 3-phosphate dehydrogenase|nr:glyceraldehyde 3-phosphate dehydrogenase NAD-binding domain-containing protein [Coriobacteriia bacterium]
MGAERTLGINGLGRIGKLTLWYHLGQGDFDRFVVNQGRQVGTSLDSVIQYLSKDSTYGQLHRYLFGVKGTRDIQVVDEAAGVIRAHGKEVVVLHQDRNPKDISWREHGASLVVDCTGRFRDPHADADDSKGSLRGHLAAGARAVVQSSPFKIKTAGTPLPQDAAILINGINHTDFDPSRHKVISAASCTTTALAHMMRPLLARDLTRNMITAGMSTVHAVTSSQPVLDAVPAAGATDLRKTRAALDNIILTSTNAAKALEQVMPEVARIGFMADSVRIPTASVSLIVLNATFQSETLPDGTVTVDRDAINDIYRQAAEGEARGLLKYSEEQNVSADMLGEDAAVVIEATETHTRTGLVDIRLPDFESGGGGAVREQRIPLTHVKVFGWYDNEMGSYTRRLGELTSHVARNM